MQASPDPVATNDASLRDLLRSEAVRLRTRPGPLCLPELLLDLGVTLSSAPDLAGRAHGILRSQNGRWDIVLPMEEGKGIADLSPRQRFTVAHELGHIALYDNGIKPPRQRREYWRIEELCNIFAGQLLIADRELEASFPRDRPTGARELLLRTKILATTLSVSFEAAARRVTAHVGQSAFVRIRISSGPHPTFVVQWATESENWLQSGRGKRLTPKHSLFGFVAQECAAQPSTIHEVLLPPRAVVASQWTPIRLDLAARLTSATT
ncbi:MAG: ImmA/IrrE family metallo-endopeptidase [Candidatus Acidiferrales bacterium]